MRLKAPAPEGLEHLAAALALLDARLAAALEAAERRFGPAAAADPYRGLYLSPDEVAGALGSAAGEPAFGAGADVAALAAASPRLAALGEEFGLAPFDLALLLVAVAPEVDLRYERVYAVLQDDVTRRRPSLDVALDLWCSSPAEKAERRRHVTADAPLVRSRLLALAADPSRPDAPLLARELVAAGPVSAYLIGAPGPHPALGPLLAPEPARDAFGTLAAGARIELARAVREAAAAGSPLRLYFGGPPGCGRHATAMAVARSAGARLLALDLARAPVDEPELDRLLRLALLEARIRGWAVLVAGVDVAAARWSDAAGARVLAAVAEHPGVAILAGAADWIAPDGEPRDVVRVTFGAAPFGRRRAAWRRALGETGLEVAPDVTEALAARFELTPAQVAGAVRAARGGDRESLFAAARMQAGRRLAEHGRRVEPVFAWDDLVLPADGKRQLRELCRRVEHRRRVLEDWGFGARLALGSGVAALFSGPSGTGKTMAAQVVAGALGLDLYRIDLSQVVSKYIGETEKNLASVFDQAEASNAILLFDEADALFGKRSEVKDAHDRYANIEVGFLLARMEDFRGVTILATNLRQNMDDAFVRRLAFHVHFPLPGERERARIWRVVLPPALPVDGDVDLDFLARRFAVSGGNIRNAALAAAFLAADEDAPVGMRHLVHGVRREFQKMGKACVEADFAPYYELLEDAA